MPSTHTYYSPIEAADFLGLSPISLACWRNRGAGPAFVKLGGSRTDRVIYRRVDLEKWRKERDRAIARERVKDKPRRVRPDGELDRRRGWPSIASRNPIKVGGV